MITTHKYTWFIILSNLNETLITFILCFLQSQVVTCCNKRRFNNQINTCQKLAVLRGKAAVFVVAFTYEAITSAKVPAKKKEKTSV